MTQFLQLLLVEYSARGREVTLAEGSSRGWPPERKD
jgi:hypothetical protein